MKWQFRLQTLFLLFVVIWSAMAAFGPWGIVVAGCCVFVGTLVRILVARVRRSPPSYLIIHVLILSFLLAMLIMALLMPVVQSAREASRQPHCKNNLKQISLALLGYHEDHGCFPPAYVADADGKPMHSWRVLILPYLSQDALYDQYDFTEPWDGPNNRKLGKTRLAVFECPSVRHRGATTDYVAVTGPQTAWPDDKATAVEDFSDGTSKTILLVEVANSDIHWMEPRDVTLDEVLSTGPQSWQAVTNHDRQKGYFVVRRWAGAHVAFADGGISLLTRPFPEDLETLFTIDDGKPAELNYRDLGQPVTSIHWPHCVGLAIFVISLILLLSRPLPKAWIEPPRNACDRLPNEVC